MNEELLITRDQLWSEIQVANKIQNILLPVNPQFKNYEIITYMEPAEIVGGDYYDIINTEKNNWVLIGDVSGHGVSAGLIMMMVQSALRTLIMDTPEIEPSILLDKVNNSISHNIKHMKEQKFMTILAFSFEDNGTIKCSGRHEDILIYRHKNKSVETIPTNGICISPWHLGNKDKTIKIDLHKNDILMLYTDGIIEARDQQNNLFGMDKLVSILQSNGEKSLQTIKNKLLTSLKSFKKNDDITILILKKI